MSSMKFFGSWLGWTLGLLLMLGVIFTVTYAFGFFTASTRGAVEAEIQIQGASNRIAAYNTFFDQCASVVALEAGIEAQHIQLESATSDREQERIRTNITGLTTERSRAIAAYNADARKDYTIGQFRDSDLPYQLQTKGPTQCGSS